MPSVWCSSVSKRTYQPLRKVPRAISTDAASAAHGIFWVCSWPTSVSIPKIFVLGLASFCFTPFFFSKPFLGGWGTADRTYFYGDVRCNPNFVSTVKRPVRPVVPKVCAPRGPNACRVPLPKFKPAPRPPVDNLSRANPLIGFN